MKTLRRCNNLLLATCALLLAPAMVLAGQASWNTVSGGKVVNGEYQIKCGEGSGWQKCGSIEKECVYDHYNMFVFIGYPSGALGKFKSTPFDWSYNIAVVFDGMREFGNGYQDITFNNMVANPADTKFTILGGAHLMGFNLQPVAPLGTYNIQSSATVRNIHTSIFGNSFFDVSDISFTNYLGETFYPGELKAIDHPFGSISGDVDGGIPAYYMYELCSKT